jgi:hypothetical protein
VVRHAHQGVPPWRCSAGLRSEDLFEDFLTIASALQTASIPGVFTHIPHASFQRLWHLARPYVLQGGGLASYLEFLEGLGASDSRIDTVRQLNQQYGDGARALISKADDIERFVGAAVGRAVRVVPQLRPRAPGLAPAWRLRNRGPKRPKRAKYRS